MKHRESFLSHSSLEQVPVPSGYFLRDVQFEMSLKPFFDTSAETREAVCRELFTQWLALTRHAESISILLFIGDGSEMLEYDADWERSFEWGRYQGSANAHEWKLSRQAKEANKDEANTGVHAWDDHYDPEKKGLHRRSYLYRLEPAELTFSWLKKLVADLKRIGRELTGKTIDVGNMFDIGPEFAVSRFKYQWHPEILAGGNSLFKGQWVSCESVLHGDDRRYAAFPDGIPDQTPIGTFMGRQFNAFFEDMGFDFLWMSNGFGFALEPWALIGNLFDGQAFYPEAAAGTRQRILKFWSDFRAEFPTRFPVRTRGTNLATGIDLGSDASPVRDIYQPDLNVDAPVNSPWAALDADFGLELSGWMSHIARHPGKTFRFRYYLQDPWWKNSPYLDRFERNPHDLFLPGSVSRVQKDGSVEIPRDIAFLTIDDSDGKMPVCIANEVTAHFLRVREFAPDDAGPLVWLYPFDDFHDLVEKEGKPEIPFHADTFIGTVINDSVPLNTVMDLGDLSSVLESRPDFPKGRIFFTPVPQPGSRSESQLKRLHEAGGRLFLYGPLPSESAFASPFGIQSAEPLEGDFQLDLRHIPDGEKIDDVSRTSRHTPFLSAGGFSEAPATSLPNDVHHLALAEQADQRRVAAALAGGPTPETCSLFWVRASLSTSEYDPHDPEPIRGPILRSFPRKSMFPYGRLARFTLDALGWKASCPDVATANAERPPYYTVHRHRNGFQFSGYHPDENAVLKLRHPLGAPLFTFRTLPVENGQTKVTGTRAWSYESRVFVESGGDGLYRCRFQMPVGYGIRRRLLITGCRDATLVFLPESGGNVPIRILLNPVFPYLVGDFVEPVIQDSPYGPLIRIETVQDDVLIDF